MLKRLILIPTYNEVENVEKLCLEILSLKLKNTDILFIDDNSPDGTGKVLDRISKKYKKVKVIHRASKDGIGSAHLDGIFWAYKQKYKELITMDCDFTHNPSYIVKIINSQKRFDIVVASRYLDENSLVGWNIHRKILTQAGHLATKILLRLNYDASGAFRLYRLDRISKEAFDLVTSKSYSFFLESLFILNLNDYKIGEISIKLPPRTYGHSKMKWKDIITSVELIFDLYVRSLTNIDSLKINKERVQYLTRSQEVGDWEKYWQGGSERGDRIFYNLVASFYRRFLIKPSLNYFVKKYFKKNAKVLHAGCGGGEVDTYVTKYLSVTALDFSKNALEKYKIRVGKNANIVYGDIRKLKMRNSAFDGIYNLGVMEHFDQKTIIKILKEFHRVLKPNGKLIIFWPPEFGLSVIFFKIMVTISKHILGKKNVKFHPPEPSRLKSESDARKIFESSGFKVNEYYFGVRDLFTYAVVIASKK